MLNPKLNQKIASNRKYIHRIVFTCSIILLSVLINKALSNPVKLKRYHFLYFGTTIQITLGLDENRLPSYVVSEIDKVLETTHYKWHPWREGYLKELNKKLNSLESFESDIQTVKIIQLSQDFYNKSHGYFNPAIGKAIEYWGFHKDMPNTNQFNNKNPLSNKLDTNKLNLDDFRKNLPTPYSINIEKITLTPNSPVKYRLHNTNKYLQLDLSGFIKADAALEIKKILLTNNINNALINIGGDIYVMGYKSAGNILSHKKYWTIAAKLGDGNVKKLKVKPNYAVASSGTYARKYLEIDNKNQKLRHHIINPQTAEPAQAFTATTVVHSDPYIADAAATALLIAGVDNYKQIASSMGIDKYIVSNEITILSRGC